MSLNAKAPDPAKVHFNILQFQHARVAEGHIEAPRLQIPIRTGFSEVLPDAVIIGRGRFVRKSWTHFPNVGSVTRVTVECEFQMERMVTGAWSTRSHGSQKSPHSTSP